MGSLDFTETLLITAQIIINPLINDPVILRVEKKFKPNKAEVLPDRK